MSLTRFVFLVLLLLLSPVDSKERYWDLSTTLVLVGFSVKGSQLDTFYPWAIVLLPCIQTKLSWKPEIIFSKSKRIIWALYSFVKKRRRVLALFISIFLRNRSLSDARWFYGKKRKLGKGNLYLTENRLSWNKMCVLQIITIICVTHVQRNF